MGMPINSYKVLELLGAATPQYDDMRALHRIIQRYRLVAVVVHDPSRHPELDRKLRDRFERLDRVTGRHLLFFALVEAREAWRDAVGDNHPLRALQQELNIPWARAAPLPAIDPELVALGSLKSLHIPVHDVPCVVVFRPGKRDYCWIRTSAETLERHLERLALAAAEMAQPQASHVADAPGQLARDLADYEPDADIQWVDEPGSRGAADRLAGVLAPSASASDPHARAHAKQVVAAHAADLQRLLMRDHGELTDRENAIADSALRFGIALAMTNGRTAAPEWSWPPRDRWELEAAGSLAVALKLQSLGDPDLDAPIVMCFGRAFEAEMNASVVQYMRQRLGAPMPEAYCAHSTGQSLLAEVPMNGDLVTMDFNQCRRRRWFPPALGLSQAFARRMTDVEAFTAESWAALLESWELLRQHRNRAAHPGQPPSPSPTECERTLRSLCDQRVIDEVFALKEALRTPR